MTTREFSEQFDVLYNNVTSNQAPGLNEYEKSVFLTKAQSQLVIEYFNNRVDSVGGGFDGSQKRQYDFSSILRTETLFEINTFKERITDLEKLDRRSKVFLFPENYFLAVNEIVEDDLYQYSVIPIDYSEYQRLMLKPYSYPVKKGAWRIITDKKNCNSWQLYINDAGRLAVPEDSLNSTKTDYTFLSSWADQKRNLSVQISCVEKSVENIILNNTDFPVRNNNSIIFEGKNSSYCKLTLYGSWENNSLTYGVVALLEASSSLDDEEVVEELQEACRQYNIQDKDTTFAKAAQHVDCFAKLTAPSHFENFSDTDKQGMSFTTSVKSVLMAELIGKFTGDITYKLRYVKNLTPIVLDNLAEGVKIDGVSQRTECELPVETHQEILERAVTLAKIAWAGSTSTQVAAEQQRNNR